MKNILQTLEEKCRNGEITIRDAAVRLYKAGWISFIDIEKTKRLLGL